MNGKKIIRFIFWQGIQKPKGIFEQINRFLYIFLEIFYIFLIFTYVQYTNINIFFKIIIIIYLALNILLYGACMDLFLEKKINTMHLPIIVFLGFIFVVKSQV
ncbi:hypothetical protein I6I92_11595 (plasmid) [Peptoniphilus asaccharolyticus]|uniref:hypothetical protein n=1 Tax=Peptoniphilus asaccharolyticus TaxID=1258 RepID=UPI000A01A867|nr:hypothetical protein [Peptoniphilus asaccharolyticus]MBL7576427.1 hypothetical protein [Peptoniphilus asaccharolyticus]